jgi:hypothetical protein
MTVEQFDSTVLRDARTKLLEILTAHETIRHASVKGRLGRIS